MENATKALIISAGILIGMIVLSMGVYLYSAVGTYVKQSHENIERQSIEKFNTQFYNYMSDEDEIFSFQDVVTVANIAYENNSKYNLSLSEFDKNDIGKNNYVQVLTDCSVDDGNNTRKINLENYVGDNGKLIELLNKNYNFNYKCVKILTSTETQRVYSIEFKKE